MHFLSINTSLKYSLFILGATPFEIGLISIPFARRRAGPVNVFIGRRRRAVTSPARQIIRIRTFRARKMALRRRRHSPGEEPLTSPYLCIGILPSLTPYRRVVSCSRPGIFTLGALWNRGGSPLFPRRGDASVGGDLLIRGPGEEITPQDRLSS